MQQRARIVVLGPTRGLLTGQAAITSIAVTALRERYRISEINTNSGGLPPPLRVLRNLWCIARILVARLRGGLLYLTPHRTLLGCLKDLLAIALWRVPIGTRGVVCHLHGADFRTFLESLPSPLSNVANALYRRVDLWIVLSARMKDQIEMLPARSICVIANCVAADSAAVAPHSPRSGALRLLFLSNLMRSKGVLELCVAVKLVNTSAVRPPLELKIAGAPIEPDVATAVRAEAATSEHITYVGAVYGTAKRELLEWADVVALPSKAEAQPLCLLEGALAGCYLIASRAGYIADLAAHLHMHLLDDIGPQGIAHALAALGTDEARRLGAANREVAQRLYSITAFSKGLNGSVEEVLARYE